MPHERIRDPVILGVCGDSATGKTTLSAGIRDVLGPDRVTVICSDDYHSFSREERAENGLSALDPRANYIDILEQDLINLRNKRPILKPVYNHNGGMLERPVYVEPKAYVIVEGLLGFTTPKMRDCYDAKIYLDPEEELRIKWKIQRDTQKRGYTREQVLASLEKRKDDSPAFIHPQRRFADIVISFYPPSDNVEESGEHLNVRQYLRPTLPHPDLSSLLDEVQDIQLSLDLGRDEDGKPVDILWIGGDIADDRAQMVEKVLWDHIPEASHLRENIGRFTGIDNQKRISHPLALTQLVLTYHMVKAALGERAV
jgi:phosphoribulokinase